MIEQSVSLASNGVVKVAGYEQLVRFGYTKNRGVYRLAVSATGEWEGLTIRCFWHVPNGKDPASSLVMDGSVDVPASVTAQPGSGCITFEGSDGAKVMTSADLRYRVSANSGTEDGTEPEPGTPAWQQLVDLFPAHAGVTSRASGAWCSCRGGCRRTRKPPRMKKSGCTNSMEKVYARLHIAIYEILYYHKSASDLSLVRRGGTPKIRFFPVEFPTVHLMRIER